jgi:enoyl reductase-like protein
MTKNFGYWIGTLGGGYVGEKSAKKPIANLSNLCTDAVKSGF